jgi:DNA-binding protein HU-beta
MNRRKVGMNKSDLANEVAKVIGTKKEAQAAVDCVFDTITTALKDKDQVTLVGFGTFKVSNRKARTGRNPKTGEAITIQARNVPKFTPSKALRDGVEEASD